MKNKIFVVLFLSIVQLKFASLQTVVTCSCDLTGSFCDANCCCDPDCSPADVSVFVCSTDTLNADSQLCVNELVYVNNLPSSVVQNDNGLFCIVRQSDTSSNSYTEPTILNSTSDFDSAAQQYPTYSYDLESETTTTSTTGYYQTGDTIGIQYASNGLQSTLSLPAPGPSTLCIGSNPASFMVDQTLTCGRRFNLSTTCVSGSVLDASFYYSPDLFQIATLPFINSVTNGSLINITICNGTSPDSVLYDSPICSNAVSAVSYTINYSGTNGVTGACASFTLSDVTTSSIVQTFSINFVADSTASATPVPRSGNPGYVVGKPLRTALQTGTSNNRTLATDVLTLITPNTDGTCPSVVSTRQITFGEDARTGCVMRFNSSQTCSTLYDTILDLLNEPATEVVVANYGQTALNSTTANDWLTLSRNETFPNKPASTTTSVSDASGCAGMLVGINYNIFYANTGSLSNPQPEIIGVSYSGTTKTVKYECFGSDCVSNANEDSLEISSTVTFTDASSSPSSILRQRPTVDARLPSDFFFPFTGTST